MKDVCSTKEWEEANAVQGRLRYRRCDAVAERWCMILIAVRSLSVPVAENV
jgi:hypothetical protein